MQLTGKTALVTGATSGIGLAIAQALAGAGASVVLNGRRPEDEAASAVRSVVAIGGATVAYRQADMLRHTQLSDMIAEVERAAGGLDILVNNAGIQHVASIEDFPLEQWDAVVASNLTAPFILMRAAIPGMRARNSGRIINIGSAHSLVASPQKSAYVAAKHGLVGLTKVAALELAETGVTVNAVSPGYVETPLVAAQIEERARLQSISEDEAQRQILAPQPTGRFIPAQNVGQLVVFLASDAAADITGANISIDGGWTAR